MSEQFELWMAPNEHTPARQGKTSLLDAGKRARAFTREVGGTAWAALVYDGHEVCHWRNGRPVQPRGIHWPIHPDLLVDGRYRRTATRSERRQGKR